MKPSLALALVAASLSLTAIPAAAKEHKEKKGGKAKIEIACPALLQREGLCDKGKIKIKHKKAKDHDDGTIAVEIKGLQGGKRTILLDPQIPAARPAETAARAAPAPAPAAPAIPASSIAPRVSPFPRPAPPGLAMTTRGNAPIEIDPRRTVISTDERTDPAAASRRSQTITAIETMPRRIMLDTEAPEMIAAPGTQTRSTTTIAGGAKTVRPQLQSVSLDDGQRITRGERLDGAVRAQYVGLRDPALFGLPAVTAPRSYLRIGDAAVVIDDTTGEVLDFLPLGSVTIN
ncbi:hypothetical protein [Profundibacterium mesophilum]|uniref:Uncharacterized protein n=1 Tax=Profundibacterium mesophilum KAUST100406-0324 TaxID=1037889 RepID=A0A921NYC5_9RHOB|nr:hypothetical protein [Profundibacterium mesophilum]KAF0677620.1 hypothetical protein PMES_00127 [Profundibacterium mesophilum KAUST100406-0324]